MILMTKANERLGEKKKKKVCKEENQNIIEPFNQT